MVLGTHTLIKGRDTVLGTHTIDSLGMLLLEAVEHLPCFSRAWT